MNVQRLPNMSQLRANAEAQLVRIPPTEVPARPADALHELQVHQIELEMQNEALRQAQIALEESRDRYVNLYEFAPVGYLTLTEKGLIAEINLTGATLLGKDRAKLHGRRFTRFIVSEDQDRWYRLFLHAVRHGGKPACELKLQRSDGTVFDGGLDGLLTSADGVAPTLRVTLTDITARKQAERANAAKSNFLAAASHDLRQPFQALRFFIDILAGQVNEPRQQDVVRKAGTALTAGEDLLHALLDVSKLDTGTVMAQRRSFAFSDIAAELLAQCDDLVRQKGLTLTVVRSSAVIDSDPVLLSRLLRNLLDNAIKYTERGRILLGCRRVKDGVRIEVWDTGIGIAADQQDHIFDDFYQIGNLGQDQSKGVGIGLAVVRRTADLLGHKISLRSWPGKGSVFAVTVGRSSEPL